MSIRKQSNLVKDSDIKEKNNNLTDADLENISGGRKVADAKAERRLIDRDTRAPKGYRDRYER
ncbi:hypothetical protein [Legionella gresilensis]|uniref:hypothetical protein n=1 Tax=Legionella gresilensis TaxID=91823 RepID=UPI001040FAC5|nr:hypothetical protein [Legionella gresilensis]